MTTGYILTVGAECLRDLSTTEATRVRSQSVATTLVSRRKLWKVTGVLHRLQASSPWTSLVPTISCTRSLVQTLRASRFQWTMVVQAPRFLLLLAVHEAELAYHHAIQVQGTSARLWRTVFERFRALTHRTWRARTRVRSGISASFAASIFPELTGKDLASFSRKPGTPWTPCFTAFRQYTEKSWGSDARISKKLPHLASSWARLA